MPSTAMHIHRPAVLRLVEVLINTALLGMIWLNPSLHDGGIISALLLIPSALFLTIALTELSYLVRGNPAVVSVSEETLTVTGPFRTRRFALPDVSVASSSRLSWPGSVVIKDGVSSVTLTDFEIGRKSRIALADFLGGR